MAGKSELDWFDGLINSIGSKISVTRAEQLEADLDGLSVSMADIISRVIIMPGNVVNADRIYRCMSRQSLYSALSSITSGNGNKKSRQEVRLENRIANKNRGKGVQMGLTKEESNLFRYWGMLHPLSEGIELQHMVQCDILNQLANGGRSYFIGLGVLMAYGGIAATKVLTPFGILCAMVVYWASTNFDGVLMAILNGLNVNARQKFRFSNLKYGGTFKEFFCSLHSVEDYKILRELLELTQMRGLSIAEAYFLMQDRFISRLIEGVDSDPSVRDSFNYVLNIILNHDEQSSWNDIPKTLLNLIDKRKAKVCAASIVLGQTFNILYKCSFGEASVVSYLVYSLLGSDNISDARRAMIIEVANLNRALVHSQSACEVLKLQRLSTGDTDRYSKELERKVVSLNQNLKNATEKIENMKKVRKAIEARLKVKEDELRKLSVDKSKLDKAYNLIDIEERYTSEVEKTKHLSNELNSAKNMLHTLDRKVKSQKKEIIDYQASLSSSRSEIKALNEKIANLEGAEIRQQAGSYMQNIPMSCFVNAIKDRKVLLLGGDIMYTKINEYGLTNIRFAEAGHKRIYNEDVVGSEIVVVATSFVSHSQCEAVESIAKRNNMDVLYFNNKNVDMLIYKLFEHFNSNK